MAMDAQAMSGANVIITERPMAPAVRATVTWRLHRVYWSELAVGGLFLLIIALVAILIAIDHPSARDRTLDLILGIGFALIICGIVVITAMNAASTLKRNLQAGIYLSATGPLRRWGTVNPRGEAIMYSPGFRSATGYIRVGTTILALGKQDARALEGASEVTVNYLPHGRVLLEVRDAEGNTLYRSAGYRPTDHAA